MKDSEYSPVIPAVCSGFILVHDTFPLGVVPAEWEGKHQVVLYETRAQAEVERIDAAEMRSESLKEAGMEEDEVDEWIEAAMLQSNGTLILVESGKMFTAVALRELWSLVLLDG